MMKAPAVAGDSSKPTQERATSSKKRERPEILTSNSNGKQQKPEKTLRSSSHSHREASSFAGKDGGLRDLASVDKLLCLMEQETIAKHTDVAASRAKLCNILSSTKNFECLNKFVEIGGLSVVDRWLHEDYNRRKLSEDGYDEDMLLSVLGALEILPVDYTVLRRSAIGKSVNLLRNHKNYELQRMSKKLVEMWKKQVDAEIKLCSHENQYFFSQGMNVASPQKAYKTRESCSFEAPMPSSGSRGRYSASDNHVAPSSSSSLLCSVDTQSRSVNNLGKPSTDAILSRLQTKADKTTRNGSNGNGSNGSGTPSSSSSPCSPENFDISRRMKVDNAACYCRSEVTVDRSFALIAADTGINLLAEIAISESSISDHKSAESHSDNTSPSASVQPSLIHQKDGGPHVYMSGDLKDADATSSIVSSLSDTTVAVETSTSSKPDACASIMACQSSVRMRTGSPNGRRFTQQPTVSGLEDRKHNPHGLASAVNESTSMLRSCGDDRLEVVHQVAMEVQEDDPLEVAYQVSMEVQEDDPLEVAYQVAMEVQQEIARRECTQRTSSVARNREEAMASSPHQKPCLTASTVLPSKLIPASIAADMVDASTRPIFDLNENLKGEGIVAKEVNITMPQPSSTQDLPTISASAPSHVISPLTVVVGSKGAFIPPVIPPRPVGEPGWRGSAATSAFRPTKPRTALSTSNKPANTTAEKPAETAACSKPILDFDLNISADSPGDGENGPQQLATENSQKASELSQKPLLDLNQADEESLAMEAVKTSTDHAQCSWLQFDLNDGGTVVQDRNEYIPRKQPESWNAPSNGMTMHLKGIQQSIVNETSSSPISSVSISPTFATPSNTAANPMASIASPTFVSPSSNGNGARGSAGFREGYAFPMSVYMQRPSGLPSSNTLHQYSVPVPASYGGFAFSTAPSPKETKNNQSTSNPSALQPSMMRPKYTMVQKPQRSAMGLINLDLNAGPEAGIGMTPTSAMVYNQAKVHPMTDASMKDEQKMYEDVMYDPRIVRSPVMNDAAAVVAMAMSSPLMIRREGATVSPWAMHGAILPKQAGGR